MGLEYKIIDSCTVNEVQEVFMRSGIRRPVGDANRLQRMIENADENNSKRRN